MLLVLFCGNPTFEAKLFSHKKTQEDAMGGEVNLGKLIAAGGGQSFMNHQIDFSILLH